MMTPKPAKKQKLWRASNFVVHPRKKAKALVKVVIVSDGPERLRACFILLSMGSLGLV